MVQRMDMLRLLYIYIFFKYFLLGLCSVPLLSASYTAYIAFSPSFCISLNILFINLFSLVIIVIFFEALLPTLLSLHPEKRNSCKGLQDYQAL